jgi:hypothetical protein
MNHFVIKLLIDSFHQIRTSKLIFSVREDQTPDFVYWIHANTGAGVSGVHERFGAKLATGIGITKVHHLQN